jgi:3-dehydroquinate synthase
MAAAALGREFVDGDALLETRWGRAIPEYFAAGDEPLFRGREAEICRELAERDGLVVAVGGGALLNPKSRAAMERSGVVVCLEAPLETLARRLETDGRVRPLVTGDIRGRLAGLLRERASHYASFPQRVNTAGIDLEAAGDATLALFAAAGDEMRLTVGPTAAVYGTGLVARLGHLLGEQGLRGPFVVLADSEIEATHGAAVGAAQGASVAAVPSGEASKNLDTVRQLYGVCLGHGLDRNGALVAVGGGVTGDVAGFVAATFMRGVAWVNAPTTVLAMADSALGGKVGVDLPEGKNLVGAFHPPKLVVADMDVLATLPTVEVRCGLAEIIKSGLVGDPVLFEGLARGSMALEEGIRRAAAVKAGIVNIDPYERGERATLNLGHTIGHGIEAASGFRLRHGEAVAIGLAAEARLAQRLGLAAVGLTEQIEACLLRAGLPVRSPGSDVEAVRALMNSDKKKAGGRLKFALPRRVGEVEWGIEVDEETLGEVLAETCGEWLGRGA